MHWILESIQTAIGNGLGSVVFPECALTGNRVIDMDEPGSGTEPIPVPSTATIERACQEGEVHAVFDLLKEEDDRVGAESSWAATATSLADGYGLKEETP